MEQDRLTPIMVRLLEVKMLREAAAARQAPVPTEIVQTFLSVAPVDVSSMARALGLAIKYSHALPDEISGKITRTGRSYQITVNAMHPPRRQRFTIAHEIAHFVLHRDMIGDGIVDDEMYRSQQLSDDVEREANKYAAIMLMPAPLVRRTFQAGTRSFVGMADAFEVSAEVARIRMKELRLGA